MSDPIVARVDGQSLVDGAWHRLHPATPLLRGGIAFVAILGVVIANLRERLIDLFIPARGAPGDPIDFVVDHGWVGWALLAVAAGLIVIIGIFYLSWRMHTFRVTDEAVEVRSGVLFRTHRKAKLDRIQGISVEKPLLARLVGASRINVSVAGQDANVKLEYLYAKDADGLRRDVLTLASGVKLAERTAAAPGGQAAGFGAPVAPGAGEFGVPGGPGAGVGAAAGAAAGTPGVGAHAAPGEHSGRSAAVSRFVTDRVDDFISPDLDPDAAPPQSVVHLSLGRLIGSVVLGWYTWVVIIAAIVGAVFVARGSYYVLFFVVPLVIGLVGYLWSGVTKSLRYSIAATPSGVRVGFGLFSTTSETIPPGRIHAIQVSQSIIWRPFGWWQVRINKAGLSLEQAARGSSTNTVLPVGSLEDAAKVVELMLAGRIDGSAWGPLNSALSTRDGTGFVQSPKRAFWINPLSWRRTGYALRDGLLLFRRGVVWRKLDILPLARLQSIRIEQGPLLRALNLASATAHTVPGAIVAELPGIAREEAIHLFESTAAGIIAAQTGDRSHRWASFDQGDPPTEAVVTAPYADLATEQQGVGPAAMAETAGVVTSGTSGTSEPSVPSAPVVPPVAAPPVAPPSAAAPTAATSPVAASPADQKGDRA